MNRNPIIASENNPTSRKLAIKAMCAHCMGVTREYEPLNWRKDVRGCTAIGSCPLWKFRPFFSTLSAVSKVSKQGGRQ